MTATQIRIRQTLNTIGRQYRRRVLMSGMLSTSGEILGISAALFLLDNLINIPGGVRLALTASFVAFAAARIWTNIFQPVLHRNSPENIAIRLEEALSIKDNSLINACQMEELAETHRADSFAEKIVEASRPRLTSATVAQLASGKRLIRISLFFAAMFILWFGYASLFPRQAANAFKRFSLPLSDVPPAGNFVLKVTPEKSITVAEGDSITIHAQALRDKRWGPLDEPIVGWKQRSDEVSENPESLSHKTMNRQDDEYNNFVCTFSDIRESFAFRVFAEGAYSQSIAVRVIPYPSITESMYEVIPPAYTGTATQELPGPPSGLSVLKGSKTKLTIKLNRAVNSVEWKGSADSSAKPLNGKSQEWNLNISATESGPAVLSAKLPDGERNFILAETGISIQTDAAPLVNFEETDLNRFVNPGDTIPITVGASDDFGVKEIKLYARPLAASGSSGLAGENSLVVNGKLIKEWSYIGPPGVKGPVKENFKLFLDPVKFLPGTSYAVEATASDFNPEGHPSLSRPLVLRVKSIDDIQVSADSPLASAFELLKETIEEQRRSNSITVNLRLNFDEAVANNNLKKHAGSIANRQRVAWYKGDKTVEELEKLKTTKSLAPILQNLVKGEMQLVLDSCKSLGAESEKIKATKTQKEIEERQSYILKSLIELLGKVARMDAEAQSAMKGVSADAPIMRTPEETAAELSDTLQEFIKEQKKIVEQTKSILENGPEDLTEEEEDILGELAREEAKLEAFLEEKLSDFSKLPVQDFSDSSVAEEFNSVFMEVKLAAKNLYEKKIDLAVPHEQSGLELAEELVQNLEKWLPDTPDYKKWEMEENPDMADVPLSELPDQLEDIIGELLDSEEAMTEEVEDVTSSWMDSLDKGAGWSATDGPISNMSAKGITGNQLPNQSEIGGRSGEGRSGRSHGQFVEETAQGKGGRQTPSRLTPSPFEQGSVEDTSTENPGGATGGGKLGGFAEEGLRGPAPDQLSQQMARLKSSQTQIRQQAEKLSLKLRARNLPSGDLETSINKMKDFENAASRYDAEKVRSSFSGAIDSLKSAKTGLREQGASSRSETINLPDNLRREIMTGKTDSIPRGYEDLVAEYYKAIAKAEE